MKLKNVLLPALVAYAGVVFSQIPILNSNPGISDKVIYLDFDGQKVTGTAWNSGNTINAVASSASNNSIRNIWNRVSEDYRPFNVNVTTDSTRFNNAQPTSRMRVIFTSTSSWYTSPAGGVAYLNSFTWGGTPGTPCWIFENQLGGSKDMAEAASHEAGHTLSLYHQSTYNSGCVKTNEYNPGIGSGVTSWAPIMGVGYNDNVTVWHNGPNANGCSSFQNDHSGGSPGITGGQFLSYLPDDVGNTLPAGKILNLNSLTYADSGLITTPTDVDLYRFTICNNRYVSLNVKPWALDTNTSSNGYQGANLDVKLKLYNSSNVLIAGDSNTTRLRALLGMNLTAGSYYFTIDGDASPYAGTDYGSLGKYYMSVKATNQPTLSSTILTPSSVCAGQAVTLSYTSNGTPTAWQWNISGPSSVVSSVSNPSVSFNAGIYTITLLASNGSYTGCPTTRTLNIGVSPVISIAGTGTVLCPQKIATLTASGATTYSWLPGNFTGISLQVAPVVNTTYTLLGSNGTCVNSTTYPISISPNFNLSVFSSTNYLCAGSSLTISASGASAYTINPGFITTNPAVLSPIGNTNYTVTGANNGCPKSQVVPVTVNPPFDITVYGSDDTVCPWEAITLSNFGGFNYTVNPGGYTGSPVVVNPSVATVYTITGEDAVQCTSFTTFPVYMEAECDDTGLSTWDTEGNTHIYPNPSSAYFMVESGAGPFNIEVVNALGCVVYTRDNISDATRVSVEEWNKGIYFVKINSGSKAAYLHKIIVK